MVRLERLVNDIYISVQSESPMRGFESSSLLYRFLLELKYCVRTGDNRSRSARRRQLQPVISFIERNYDKSFGLEEMAAVIEVTPQHLCRLFKQNFNMRPFAYLTGYRLQKAKELMVEEPGWRINEIAEKTGFNDSSYFCSLFKQHEGVTPMEFRKMHRSI